MDLKRAIDAFHWWPALINEHSARKAWLYTNFQPDLKLRGVRRGNIEIVEGRVGKRADRRKAPPRLREFPERTPHRITSRSKWPPLNSTIVLSRWIRLRRSYLGHPPRKICDKPWRARERYGVAGEQIACIASMATP